MNSIGPSLKKVNQIRTIFVLCAALAISSPLHADLGRQLKQNEIKALQRNIQRDPENVRSRLFLGHHHYALSEFQQTVDVLAPVTESLPDEELQILAISHLRLSRYREALAIVGTLLSRESTGLNTFLLAIEIDNQIAEQASFTPEGDEAKSRLFNTLKSAQKAFPKELRVYEAWLESLEKQVPHFAFEALRVLEDMKKNQVEYKPMHYSMACRYNYEAGFTKETQIACEQASRRDPENPKNSIFLAQSLIDSGEGEKGKRMLASVGEKFSHSAAALHAAAVGYQEAKNLTEAYNYFKKATTHPDVKSDSFLGLGQVAFELRKYSEALKAFTEHCRRTQTLHQEFRKASGLLIDQPLWQNKYRLRMTDCNKTQVNKTRKSQ